MFYAMSDIHGHLEDTLKRIPDLEATLLATPKHTG